MRVEWYIWEGRWFELYLQKLCDIYTIYIAFYFTSNREQLYDSEFVEL